MESKCYMHMNKVQDKRWGVLTFNISDKMNQDTTIRQLKEKNIVLSCNDDSAYFCSKKGNSFKVKIGHYKAICRRLFAEDTLDIQLIIEIDQNYYESLFVEDSL